MRLTPLDGAVAAQQVVAWGYPRDLVEGEEEFSWWFAFGPGIWWLNQNIWCTDGEVALHVCLPPGAHTPSTPNLVKWWHAVETVAEILGMVRVMCWLPPTQAHRGLRLAKAGWVALPSRDQGGNVAWGRDLLED